MNIYVGPRTVLVFAIVGTLIFGWLGISGLLEGADIWKPVLALAFAIVWFVVSLTIWKKSRANISLRNNPSPGRD